MEQNYSSEVKQLESKYEADMEELKNEIEH